MQFDMTKQKATHGPVEAGTYTATIEGAEEGTYNESQYIELTLRLENRRVVWDRLLRLNIESLQPNESVIRL